ncbi:hypothetical protein MPL3356_60572 [Mesorhizobium plurifarium]|uniref:Uncharacterized protein n=1 Tax=Mesorhizobium plurifarium TaxID=69974 RepID=A0A090EA55_MESPL|nr:hypothetical protein MPL3356_60572 [Mesorhizobium plurifarium]
MKEISLIYKNAIGPGLDQFIGLETTDAQALEIARHEFVRRGDIVYRKVRETDKSILYESVDAVDVTLIQA